MSTELCFLAFCITIVALTAISHDKSKVAEKALPILNRAMEIFYTILINKRNASVGKRRV